MELGWPFDGGADRPTSDMHWGAYFQRATTLVDLRRRFVQFELRKEQAQRKGDALELDALGLTSFGDCNVPYFAEPPAGVTPLPNHWTSRTPRGVVSWDRDNLLVYVEGLDAVRRWQLVPRSAGKGSA